MKRYSIVFIAFAAFFSAWATASLAQTTVSGDIVSDTTWTASGNPYIVIGDVTVLAGVTLTIEHGVIVKFDDGTTLHVKGALDAIGFMSDSVYFTSSSASPSKGIWNGLDIRTTLGGTATIQFCNFMYAGTAVYFECCGSTTPSVRNSRFFSNVMALGGYTGWPMPVDGCVFDNNTYAVTQADKRISNSTFTNNDYGLYATERISVYNSSFSGHTQVALYGGRGEVKNCVISNNNVGIQGFYEGFITRNSTISSNDIGVILYAPYNAVNYNNIRDNTTYDIKNTDIGNKDATNNWWGTTDTSQIKAKIYDYEDSAAFGVVVYKPYRQDSVPTGPTVTSSKADSVTQTSAALNGSITPNGDSTTGWFEWGTTVAYGDTTPVRSLGNGSNPVQLSELITGLLPNTSYYFRAVGQNANGTKYSATRVFTTLPPPSNPTMISVRDIPADQGGKVTVVWKASVLDVNVTTLPYYSIWRALPLGMQHPVTKINAKNVTKTFKGPAYRMKEINGMMYAWEWIANQQAHNFSEYSYSAPTPYDSMSLTNGKVYFLVSAHTNNPIVFYDSNVDSGYSVDNIPPLTPRNTAGTPGAGRVTVHWSPNPEADLRQYVVYRGTSLGNITQIATVKDTQFVDMSPPQSNVVYYAVSAQDIHDNPGPRSNPIAVNLTGVIKQDGELPSSYALHQNYPNPFNPSTTITFALPRSGPVELKVYDVLGNEVAILVQDQLQRGTYRITWDPDRLSSGVYFYRLTTPGFNDLKKLVLVR